MFKLFFILLVLSVKVSGQVSPDSSHTKAGWSAKEKSVFIESCIKYAIDSMNEAKARAYCTCMQQKMEVLYRDIEDLNNKITEEIMQTPKMRAMVNSCLGKDSNNTIKANRNYNEDSILTKVENDDKDSVFSKVEVEAAFPGGDVAWRRYLEKNLMNFNPADNGAPNGNYTVRVVFTVDKEGKIGNVTTLTHYGFGMEEIAIKIIKNGPRWTPAIQDGHNVKAWRKQPITFQVISE